jgi:hypothetical protein
MRAPFFGPWVFGGSGCSRSRPVREDSLPSLVLSRLGVGLLSRDHSSHSRSGLGFRHSFSALEASELLAPPILIVGGGASAPLAPLRRSLAPPSFSSPRGRTRAPPLPSLVSLVSIARALSAVLGGACARRLSLLPVVPVHVPCVRGVGRAPSVRGGRAGVVLLCWRAPPPYGVGAHLGAPHPVRAGRAFFSFFSFLCCVARSRISRTLVAA